KLDKKVLPLGRKHTHNALDDAIEQAEIFRRILEIKKTS
ncbi:MAG: 3'-5' exoribonuclease, partial [Thaumarchaeota archaeon]